MVLITLAGFILALVVLLHLCQVKSLFNVVLGAGIPFIFLLVLSRAELALIWFALFVVAAFFVEAQKRKVSLFLSGFLSVYVAVVAVVLSSYVIVGGSFDSLAEVLKALFESEIPKLPKELQKNLLDRHPTSKDFILSFVFGVAISLTAVLSISLVLIKNLKNFSRHWRATKLSELVLPPIVLWVFAIVLVLTLTHSEQLWGRIGESFAVFCAILFFLQGASILGYSFDLLRVNGVWRCLWAVMLVLSPPMALLFALIGLIDYWIDFRGWLLRRHKKIKERREQ